MQFLLLKSITSNYVTGQQRKSLAAGDAAVQSAAGDSPWHLEMPQEVPLRDADAAVAFGDAAVAAPAGEKPRHLEMPPEVPLPQFEPAPAAPSPACGPNETPADSADRTERRRWFT
ncbi:hypothetical protein M9458_051238 [Cirrhinus mrigala]|uniref:Uncharacterized protein n=1 Tax=Cirrhinus mrigala TaxID=683832 RepID=A0ABD0MTV4_CIRMR